MRLGLPRRGQRASTKENHSRCLDPPPVRLGLRATRCTPNGTVVGGLCDPDSAFSAAVGPELRETVCLRNGPRKAQHSTAARTSRLKGRSVANLLHWFSHRQQCSTLKYFDGRAPLASGDRPAAAQWLPMLRQDRRSPSFAAAAPFLRSRVGL